MIGIFLVASASASDLNEEILSQSDDDSISVGKIDQTQEELSADEIDENKELSVIDTSTLSANYTPTSSFEIQTYVDHAADEDTIILDGYYLLMDTINVNKTLNFVGINNATLDGNNTVQLFNVSKTGVTFKNITFKNGKSDNGGAVYFRKGGSVVDCSFVNNSAIKNGGAVYFNDGEGSVEGSTFINNTAKDGGALKNGGSEISKVFAMNCNFINNFANGYGGAIDSGSAINCNFSENRAYNRGGAMSYGDAVNCTFMDNSVIIYEVYNDGGAMFSGHAENCVFINNSAYQGGAASYVKAVNCSFINNVANSGGAMIYCSAFDSDFINNSAESCGGAIYYDSFGYYGEVINCSFFNNSASNGGSIYNLMNMILNVFGSSFANNSAKNYGGDLRGFSGNVNAVNCSFFNNTANTGGVMYEGSAVNCSFFNNTASNGGAMYKSSASNCSFVNNSATNYGGAMYNCFAFNCSFFNNSAVFYGGAICDGENVINCIFINNFAKSFGGAIVYVKNIVNSTFVNNSARIGGAVYGQYHTGYYRYIFHNSLVENCSFVDNSASYGGALYLGNALNCSFQSNHADYGGAVCIKDSESNITYCLFKSNFADFADAIYCNNSAGLNVTGCNFTDSNEYLIIDSFSVYDLLDCVFDTLPGYDYSYTSILDVDDLLIYFNENKNLIANLYTILGPLVNNKVIFTLDNLDYEYFTNEEGVVEFDISSNLDSFGEYNLSVSYAGDEHFKAVSKNITVVYKNYKGVLTCSVDGKYFNDTILTFMLLNSKNNVGINNAQITVTFSPNGEIVTLKTNTRGIATYRLPFRPYPSYGLVANVNESYVDVNTVNLTNIEIKSISGDINLSTLNDNHTLRVKLYNKNTLDVFRNVRVTLTFSPNDVVADVITDENGVADYEMDFENGVYYVIASVDRNFKQFEDTPLDNIVISNLSDSEITFTNDIVFDFGDYGSTNFTVEGGTVDRDNIGVLNHSEAIISLSGNIITVFGLSVGKYVLMVETTPDEYHYAVNRTLNITVNNVKSKVTLKTGVIFEYGSSASIHVTVDGGIVEGKNIQILNHPEAKITLSGDVITISGLNVGSYILSVTSTPDSDHTAATSNVDVTVKKATAVISASEATVALKSGAMWVVKIVDSKSKNPIAKMNVALKVYSGKKFTVINLKTNSKGEVSYQTRKLSKGTHKIVVSVTDSRYNFNTLTSSIKVVKQTPLKFKLKKKVDDNGGSLRSFLVLNKKTKKGVNGIKVKVLIYTGKKYKTYTFKTKKIKGKKVTYNGAFGFATNKFSVGKHKVKIMPASIKYKGSVKTTIKITKKARKGPKFMREV